MSALLPHRPLPPWPLEEKSVRQVSHVGAWGGRLVVPIPELAVIDPKELR